MRRSPIGQERTARYQAEQEQARAFEQLLSLHRVDYWHVNLPMRSKAGWPDYTLFGDSWHAWVELKAVSPTTGRKGKVSAEQWQWKAIIERGGGEWMTFTLPRDLEDANAWLRAKTGRQVTFT